MIRLDKELLAADGLSRLPSNLADMTLRAIYAALEHQSGIRLAAQMTDAQIDEFEALIRAGDEDAALAWIERSVPSYRQIVLNEWEIIHGRLKTAAPWLVTVTMPN